MCLSHRICLITSVTIALNQVALCLQFTKLHCRYVSYGIVVTVFPLWVTVIMRPIQCFTNVLHVLLMLVRGSFSPMCLGAYMSQLSPIQCFIPRQPRLCFIHSHLPLWLINSNPSNGDRWFCCLFPPPFLSFFKRTLLSSLKTIVPVQLDVQEEEEQQQGPIINSGLPSFPSPPDTRSSLLL